MLSPRDAVLAEAYAAECEDRARNALSGGRRSGRSVTVASPTTASPRQLLFCED
jgi:hypothetical protein